MSRCVKNLRREGNAGGIAPATQIGKKGTNRTVQQVTRGSGRDRKTAMPNIESASTPRFDQPSRILNKYSGY